MSMGGSGIGKLFLEEMLHRRAYEASPVVGKILTNF